MLSERLLGLYPRAWRERYGAEFLATVEHGPLHWQQALDIVSGAIDAWLSSDVHRATMSPGVAPSGGGPIMQKSLIFCNRSRAQYTKRDGLIGAGVMIVATVLLTAAGFALKRSGFTTTAQAFLGFAFPASLTLSMPFWLMKRQPWKAQVVIVGTMLAILIGIGYLATLIAS